MASAPSPARPAAGGASLAGGGYRRRVPTIGGVSVPSRVQAVSILLELDPPDWMAAHSGAVAEVAAFLAARIAERGIVIDRAVVEAAALLHDVDKLLPPAHSLKALGHGEAGAAWLSERGHPELARAVAHHPATLLSDEARYPRWAAFASREERVVAYADKRATRDVVSLDERFGEWNEKHPEHAAALRFARSRAARLERDVCTAAGIAAEEVQRLPWVAEAMKAGADAAR